MKEPGLAPGGAYRKRLYVRPAPPAPAILHVRVLGAPWSSYTVQFRDWLRASPAARHDYEQAKEQAAATHAGDADFDDYTRAKGAFFDQVQAGYQQTAGHHDAAGSTWTFWPLPYQTVSASVAIWDCPGQRPAGLPASDRDDP